MKEIITIQNLLIYLIIVNLVGFAIMYIDKQKAKKAKWRIQEKTIFIITAIGGGIGTITGMHLFRHKTQKPMFKYGLPFLLVLDIALIICLIAM